MNPAMIDVLLDIHQRAQDAGHGGRSAIYEQGARTVGCSVATLHRRIRSVAVKAPRKLRSDAGQSSLSRAEAGLVSALLMDSLRKNNKRLMSLDQATALLRANGEIRAVDDDGRPLSVSTVSRALRTYGLHPDQLLRPAPHSELRSLHPNHVWQIDASLCVLYYLAARSPRERGLQVMDADKFYKNKPANLARIESERVWSYEVTDHYSGAIFVRYVLGAESATNLAECFIAATQPRGDAPFYGVPLILMMDMGSANTSGAFKNLARRLQVRLEAHMPGNARATGQVEKARDIIERSFESGLRLKPVADLDELNAAGRAWAHWYNASKVHRRHGKTRYASWMEIRPEHLRTVDGQLATELLTHHPEARQVSGTLTVSFKGREYDVRDVPRVMVGEKLLLTHNPYKPDCAIVVETTADDGEVLHSVPQVVRDEGGFRADAPVIGEAHATPASTPADEARRTVEHLATDTDNDADAAAVRKARAASFGGRIDPQRLIDATPAPTWLPRTGTELTPKVRTSDATPERLLTLFEAAQALLREGVTLTADVHARIAEWHPDGVPEGEIGALAQRLSARARLRVVGQ